MIKALRKFLRKQVTAINLAKFDLLFLLKDLYAFKHNIKLAALFVKVSPLNLSQRVQNFLQSRNNYILDLLVDELSADVLYKTGQLFYLKQKTDSLPENECPFKVVRNSYDIKYCLYLFQEIIAKDFPQFPEQYAFFKNRLETAVDMRLYAAELQNWLDGAMDSNAVFPIEINWIKTNKDNLYLESPVSYKLTQNLPIPAQQNLCSLFLYMLFEKSMFVSSWNQVAVTKDNKVHLLDFDAVYEASVSLKKFALNPNREIQTFTQLKLIRGLELLKVYCPKVNIEKELEKYKNYPLNESPNLQDERKNFINILEQNGFDFGATKNKPQPASEKSKRLYSSPKHNTDTQFAKSSVYYWGPLVLAAFILYIFYTH